MNFFATGIVFYSWMPHDDKTGYEVPSSQGIPVKDVIPAL